MPPPNHVATRINSFLTPGRSVADAVRRAAVVEGLTALELNYPQHVARMDAGEVVALLAETRLRLSGLNLRFEGEAFARGAFTSPDGATRKRAITLAHEAVALAGRLGAAHVVLWMADDGFDYPFQVDYERLWRDEIDGFRRVAECDSAIRVSVEYKPSEPRRYALIRSMGDALLAARDVDRPNFGVTFDFCHSLMAGEHPAAAVAAALREGRLFGVHLNDGYGRTDDGLMVGSIHPRETLEVLSALRRGGYDGTIYFDTFPVREDPVAELRANVAALARFEATLDRLDAAALGQAQATHDAVAAQAAVLAAEAAGR